MNLRTMNRYHLRRLQLPQEYQLRLQTVKHRISQITGKTPSIETIICALIDEFINLHGESDDLALMDTNVSGDVPDVTGESSYGGFHE